VRIGTGRRQWREGLHGLTLGWLGAVIVVVALGAAVVLLLAINADAPQRMEDQIRDFYGSHAGGDAPPSAVAALQIDECSETGDTSRAGFFLYVRPMNYGNREFFACFSFDVHGVLQEGGLTLAGLTSECDVVLYDGRAMEFRNISPV
jgi:hypothetical protein